MSNRFVSDIEPAILALSDGSVFYGIAIGAQGQAIGEVVFNTAMTGYQEILTDPSYADQIVTLTHPHIGNVGVNTVDRESNQVWAKGLVIRELSPLVSNWRAQQSLSDYLQQQQVVTIAQIDTRRLTQHLRNYGAQAGCIMTGWHDSQQATAMARTYSGLKGKDFTKVVSTAQPYTWTQSLDALESALVPQTKANKHVIVYDFGVKQQILRLLVTYGCQVTVVPAQTSVSEVLSLQPDGILFSNGPGDPAACEYAIFNIQALLKYDIPLFGICLGFQLLALAYGSKTSKMKFGHHGANHPVQNIQTGAVAITSQNHGFCVEEDTLPETLMVTHRSLFDGTLQGFKHRHQPIFAFQGHPEAGPGPHDIIPLFDDFINSMQMQPLINNK